MTLAVMAIAIVAVVILSAMSLGLVLVDQFGPKSKIKATCTNYAIIGGDYQIEIYSLEDSTTTVVAEGSIGARETTMVDIPIEAGSYQITFTMFLTGYAGVDYAHMGPYGIENVVVEEGKTYSVSLSN